MWVLQKIKNLKIKIQQRYKCWLRRKKIKNKKFTIISNNCWGGFIYQMFGLEYTSPTIGLFIMESDYIKFILDLKNYLKYELIFIDVRDSKFYQEVTNNGKKNIEYPIAKLGDIEIFFMHYHSKKEAKEKWERRCKRINFENLIIKMSQRTDCTDAVIHEFSKLEGCKKICFTKKKYNYDECIYIKELNQLDKKGGDETELTLKYVDIYEFINRR